MDSQPVIKALYPLDDKNTRLHALFVFLPYTQANIALQCPTTLFTWHRLADTKYKKCSALKGIGKIVTLYPQAVLLFCFSSLFGFGRVGLFCLFGFYFIKMIY